MIASPFQQQGNTVMVTANTSGSVPTPVQASASNGAGPLQYVITNLGANAVFVGFGPTSAAATAAAVIPTGGGTNGKAGFWVLPSSQISRTCSPNCFFTGITAAGTSDIHFEPGEGI